MTYLEKINEQTQKAVKVLAQKADERKFSEIAKEFYTTLNSAKKSKLDDVLNNVYRLSISAESEQVQLQAAKEIRETLSLGEPKEQKQENTQINFYQNASNQISENVQRLIAASPKQEVKKGIEGII